MGKNSLGKKIAKSRRRAAKKAERRQELFQQEIVDSRIEVQLSNDSFK